MVSLNTADHRRQLQINSERLQVVTWVWLQMTSGWLQINFEWQQIPYYTLLFLFPCVFFNMYLKQNDCLTKHTTNKTAWLASVFTDNHSLTLSHLHLITATHASQEPCHCQFHLSYPSASEIPFLLVMDWVVKRAVSEGNLDYSGTATIDWVIWTLLIILLYQAHWRWNYRNSQNELKRRQNLLAYALMPINPEWWL